MWILSVEYNLSFVSLCTVIKLRKVYILIHRRVFKMKRFTLDLRGLALPEDIEGAIKSGLDQRRLLGKGFLYTILDAERADRLEEKGTYREKAEDGFPDDIFGYTQDQLVWGAEEGVRNTMKIIAREYEVPGLAVYNKKKFDQVPDGLSEFQYRFKNPGEKKKALIALLRMEGV